ncbi:MAG: hypothetical protein GWP15_01795, partial [Nitrospirae bacterium]|nr:hypothetical protein [Nitrospirota bacterium]
SESIELQSLTSNVLESSLKEHFPEANVSSIHIIDFDENFVNFSGTIKVESGVEFSAEDQEKVYSDLSEQLGLEVNMELEIVPIVLIPSEIDVIE